MGHPHDIKLRTWLHVSFNSSPYAHREKGSIKQESPFLYRFSIHFSYFHLKWDMKVSKSTNNWPRHKSPPIFHDDDTTCLVSPKSLSSCQNLGTTDFVCICSLNTIPPQIVYHYYLLPIKSKSTMTSNVIIRAESRHLTPQLVVLCCLVSSSSRRM